jgi:uncharacterized protein (DUF1501 family)
MLNAPLISRRQALKLGATAFFAAGPHTARAAAGRDRRLVVVVLRGALDGLAMAAPAGDPNHRSARGELALIAERDGGFALDGTFLLHPAMSSLARLYRERQALIVHAVATPYRERSHFDGQNVLENGLAGVDWDSSGWLNRVVATLSGTAPESDGFLQRLVDLVAGAFSEPRPKWPLGLAAGHRMPLIMRGSAPVVSWSPLEFPAAPSDTRARLLDIYRRDAPELADALERGLMVERATGGGEEYRAALRSFDGPPEFRPVRATVASAARLLKLPDGPRIGVLDLDGFDTHVEQDITGGQIGDLLTLLDLVIGDLAYELVAEWRDTVAVFITEFGRTVSVNGNAGTDHGTATLALVVGGGVNGGRVLADWPGLAPAAQYEGRDLRPTMDLRAVLKGVLEAQFDIPRPVLENAIFPGSAAVRPAPDLLI